MQRARGGVPAGTPERCDLWIGDETTWTCVCALARPPLLLLTPHRRSPPVSWDGSIRTPSEPDLFRPDLSIVLSFLLFVSLLLHFHSHFTLFHKHCLSLSLILSYKLSLHLSPHLSISLIFLNLPAQSKVRITFSLSLIPLPHLPVVFSSLTSSPAPSLITS